MSRPADQARPTSIEPFPTQTPGSVLITAGQTRVLCTASIAADPPRWIEKNEQGGYVHGWVSAEYNMLPGSTPERKRRGTDGRSTEIQRLIGRSLRAGIDMDKMPGLAVTVDCDVLSADGGTRTAAITGGMVALAAALAQARQDGRLQGDPIRSLIAATSVGLIDGQATLDLDYPLDSRAEVDMNVVMDAEHRLVEVQGAAERGTFDRDELNTLLDLAGSGISQLIALQRDAIERVTSGHAWA